MKYFQVFIENFQLQENEKLGSLQFTNILDQTSAYFQDLIIGLCHET